MDIKAYIDRVFQIRSSDEFERLALEAFHYQCNQPGIYSDFVRTLGRPEPKNIGDIPFLPISFFKSHPIIGNGQVPLLTFKSSGTTGNDRSVHLVAEPNIYERSFTSAYELFVGDPKHQVIVALLPNYLEQGDSSLVYMIDSLIKKTGCSMSGFCLGDKESVLKAYHFAVVHKKTFVLFGVTYALLDLAEQGLSIPNSIVFETGGMKGRREEWSKERLHETLSSAFGVAHIASEYGMTELLSQAYSMEKGLFSSPPWMKILLRDVNDPLSPVKIGKTGGINVIDLANIHSCCFIATQDLGRMKGIQFQLMGRFDHTDIRGCNLLVQ